MIEMDDLDPGTLEVTDIHRKKYGEFKQIVEKRLWREKAGSGTSFSNCEDGSKSCGKRALRLKNIQIYYNIPTCFY